MVDGAGLSRQQKRLVAGAVAEVDEAQVVASRHLTVAQKYEQAFSMIEIAEEVASYRLRQRRPELSKVLALHIVRKADVTDERAPEMADETMQFREFLRSVLDALEAAQVEYLIGGAVATWAWGEARTTRDFDVVVNLPGKRIVALSQELAKRSMAVPHDVIIDLLLSPADLPISTMSHFYCLTRIGQRWLSRRVLFSAVSKPSGCEAQANHPFA